MFDKDTMVVPTTLTEVNQEAAASGVQTLKPIIWGIALIAICAFKSALQALIFGMDSSMSVLAVHCVLMPATR